MREVFVEIVLGLLIKGVNEFGVGSFSLEIADDIEEDGCKAQELISIDFEFLNCKERTGAEVLPGLGLWCGLWADGFFLWGFGLLYGDLRFNIDFLDVVFFDVLGVECC